MAWRQPLPNESRLAAIGFGTLSLIVFATLNYHEIRKNTVFQPAECEPYYAGLLQPKIKPYRHCYTSCFGCFPTWSPVPCSFKMGLHHSINQYDMQAAYHVAGTCGGSSCCAQEVCNKCTRTETRCRRKLLSQAEGVVETHLEVAMIDGQVLNTTRVPHCDRNEDGGRNVELGREAMEVDAVAGRQGNENWLAPLRRRLEGCRQVSETYSCNCRCVRTVHAKACNVRCVPHWRSFIPVRVSVFHPERGFYPSAQDASGGQAVQAFRAELSVNATPASVEKQHVNQTDTSKLVQVAESYSLPAYATQGEFVPVGAGSHSRVVTVQFEFGPSRQAALNSLEHPSFYPGVVSECYYDPEWSPSAVLIPHTQLYFGHEMGYTWWKWLLLALLLAATFLSVLLFFEPSLLGGEVVVLSQTVIHADVML